MGLNKKLTIFSLVLFLTFKKINGDIFSSFEQMRKLAEIQSEVTGYLERFLEFQSKRLEEANELIKDFKFISENSHKDPGHFVGNPVNAYLLIKKLYKDLQQFVDTLNTFEKLKETVNDVKENFNLPTEEDYNGVIKAMHRLEDTYLLNPNDIRNGNLSSKHPSRPLTAYECFELGRVAYEKEDFYHAIRWFNESLKQVELETQKPSVQLFDILDYYAYSTAQQGNIKHAVDLTKRALKIDPNHTRSKANLEYFEKALKEAKNKIRGDNGDEVSNLNNPFEFKNPRPPHVLGYERDVYEALCRGDYKLPRGLRKRLEKLKCRYVSYNPMLAIAPVKEELVYDDPPIWLYHDVITEKQIELMKELATPKLRRAIVRSPITGKYETADYRISKSGWLTDREHPTLPYLSKLLTAVTNLSMETAEEWQIANYGIGGQYEPHFDFARKSEPGDAFGSSIGNRIATWLFYLESPEVGGATVFPPLGASIKPIRRAAVFWYNLYPSGNGDSRTRHAACPVLFGTKWVSNKWIHAVGQEFRRPCELVKEKTDEF